MVADSRGKVLEGPGGGAASSAPGLAIAASQGLGQPRGAEAGTYAATATPFQGDSHSILTSTPSISAQPSASVQGQPQHTAATHAADTAAAPRPPALQEAQQVSFTGIPRAD